MMPDVVRISLVASHNELFPTYLIAESGFRHWRQLPKDGLRNQVEGLYQLLLSFPAIFMMLCYLFHIGMKRSLVFGVRGSSG
jgi:hypothetical protein